MGKMTKVIAKSGTLEEIGKYCNKMFGPATVRVSDKKKRKMWAMRMVITKVETLTPHPRLKGVNTYGILPKTSVEVSFRNPQHATLFQLQWL